MIKETSSPTSNSASIMQYDTFHRVVRLAAVLIFVLGSLVWAQPDDVFLEISPSWQSTDIEGRQRLAAGDLNGDEFPDIYSACRAVSGLEGRDRIYFNDNGVLQQLPTWTQSPVTTSISVALADMDLDRDLDVAIADMVGGAIYVNNYGSLELYPSWQSSHSGSTMDVDWAWVTFDPYPELVCINDNPASQNIPSALHINTIGTMSLLPDWTNEVERDFCSAWGDIDNDGDPDLCVGVFQGRNHIYRTNNGELETWAHWSSFLSDGTQDIALADINADGWLDVVEAGWDTPNRVYFNQGNGEFETSPSWSSTVVTNTWQMAVGDINNDGYIDLACGTMDDQDTDMIFENSSSGLNPVPTWTSALLTSTVGMVMVDLDMDNDLDLVTASAESSLFVYDNLIQTPNTPPLPPTGLAAEVVDSSVTLSWNDAIDAETPVLLLTYNLRVGTSTMRTDIVYAQLGPDYTNPSFGNMWHVLTKTLEDLNVGTYYWSVQTVDVGYSRSEWATEQSFEIEPSSITESPTVVPQEFGLQSVYPNPFNPATTLSFNVPHTTSGRLAVFNTSGQVVTVISEGNFQAGKHQLSWDGYDQYGNAVSSGIYLFVLHTKSGSSITKGILLR